MLRFKCFGGCVYLRMCMRVRTAFQKRGLKRQFGPKYTSNIRILIWDFLKQIIWHPIRIWTPSNFRGKIRESLIGFKGFGRRLWRSFCFRSKQRLPVVLPREQWGGYFQPRLREGRRPTRQPALPPSPKLKKMWCYLWWDGWFHAGRIALRSLFPPTLQAIWIRECEDTLWFRNHLYLSHQDVQKILSQDRNSWASTGLSTSLGYDN